MNIIRHFDSAFRAIKAVNWLYREKIVVKWCDTLHAHTMWRTKKKKKGLQTINEMEVRWIWHHVHETDLYCYVTSTDFVHVLVQNKQSSIDKLVTSNRLPLFANVRRCTQTIVSSRSPPKSINGRCLSAQTRLHLHHSASVCFLLLSFYLSLFFFFFFFLLSHLRDYWNCIPLFNWSYPRVVLPPTGFEIMHHLHTFHGNPELGTRPSKEPCSIERAMELLKAWHESDRPFFTKKDLQDVSNQLNRRYSTRRKSNSKQLVSVKGLSGTKIYYEVITGQVLSGAENEEWEVWVVNDVSPGLFWHVTPANT